MSSDGRKEHRQKIQRMLAARDQAQKFKDDLAAQDKIKKAAQAKAAAIEAKRKEAADKLLAEKLAQAARPRKVLVCGDARGGLAKLAATVEAQASKVGAFDLVLCVGSFFAEAAGVDEAAAAFLRGESRLPTRVHFIDTGAALLHASPGGRQLCENLHFLGGYGIREVCGLRVAFLSGVYDPTRYDRSDVDFVGGAFTRRAVSELMRVASEEKHGVDILLTSGWPADLDLKVGDESLRPAVLGDGAHWRLSAAPPLADLCFALEPRYHVFGAADLFYQRPPFQVPRLEHVCRCIGLGSVGGAGKQRKWLHALSLSPMRYMKKDDLRLLPTNTTPNPFVGRPKPEAAQGEPTGKRKLPEADDDAELPERAVSALLAGEAQECRSLLGRLADRGLLCEGVLPERRADPKAKAKAKAAPGPVAGGLEGGAAQDAAQPGGAEEAGPRKMPKGTAVTFKEQAADEWQPETEEEKARAEAAKEVLATVPEKGVVRYTFRDEGSLGIRLSRDVPPWILEVRDGTLSAKKAPRVPVGGVVLAVNGFELKEKDDKIVAECLKRRPVIIDVQWPLDQGQPTVLRA